VESAVSLTLNEAGYVVEQSNTAINRAVDRGVIKAKLQRRGKTRLRKVGPAELRALLQSLLEDARRAL
jgi:ribosomal protein S20